MDERAQTVTHKRIANINPGGLGDFVRRYEFPLRHTFATQYLRNGGDVVRLSIRIGNVRTPISRPL